LHRITPEIVSGFYRRWYTAKNMILVVTGNFSTDRLKEDIQGIFAALPASAPPKQRLPKEPAQDQPRLSILRGPVTQSHLMIGFPIPAASGKESPVLDLLAFILGRGESSRFAEKIKVSRGLVNSISASTFSTKDPGLFIVEAQVEANKLMDATAAILQEVYRLRRERVAPWELDRAHTNFERAMVRAKETLDGQARQLGNFASVYRDPDYAEIYLKNLRRLDAEDLRIAAQSFFKTETLSVALWVPEATAEVPDAEKIAVLSRSLERPAPATQPRSGVLAATLDNGLRIVIEEDHRLPVVALHAGVIGGLAVENERSNGIGNFIAQMLTQGTPRWSSPQLIRAVEELGGTLNGWSGNSAVGLSGTFPSRHVENALEIFLDALLHPAFPERELEKKRQEILLRFGNREERGRDRALRFFYQTLLVDHPYRFDPSGQREPVMRLRREDLVAQYQKLFSPERMVVSVAGDVEGENILRYLRTRLASLRRSGATFDLPPAENGRRELRAAKRTSQTVQSQVVMGFQAPAKGAPGYFTMKVLEAILSRIGGRLFVDLRDQQGLAYSVGAFSLDDPLQGAFGVYAATDPANVEKIKQEMLATLRRLREEEVLPDELERAKNYLIGQYWINRQAPAAKAADLADNELFGFGRDYSKRYQEEIQRVNAVDILKFAYRYLPPEGYTLAVVGP
jgi:zinc protease